MAQVNAITINDGSATPVAVTFTPEVQGNTNKVVFMDRRKGSRALQPAIIVEFSPPTAARDSSHASIAVEYPIEGVVNGIPAKVGVCRFRDGKFIFPSIASATDRAHTYAFAYNAMGNTAVMRPTLRDGEAMW